ncbi:putative protease [Chromobacterium violaceum]|uniref:Ubiquinone biosynthesis protein UbiV n=1 Tax=Chromobacterium violaceum TaxID=536 RepID=A0A3S5DLX9_CHRVL|nr:putative protease [Chromobacterium violaceum]
MEVNLQRMDIRMNPIPLKLSLGPVLFFWSRDDILRFYAEAADWPLDTLYLGEVVCGRRQQLRGQDWISLAADLGATGREVVLSCQALIESESDLKRLRKMVDNGQVAIEANDLGAVRLASEKKLPFVAGTHLNIYNADTLALMRRLGAYRWLPPVEMGRDTLAALLAAARSQQLEIDTEVFAWGRLPLALSSRCFTARHYNLNKDDCQFRCLEHPDGLRLDTREGQHFLAINGIQTMSDGCQALLPTWRRCTPPAPAGCGSAAGARHRRRSPGFPPAAGRPGRRGWLAGRAARPGAGELVDGYWRGQAGIHALEETR